MKYLHIMTMPSLIYNNMIVEMINNENYFNLDEHTFVFSDKKSYDVSKQYLNVKLNVSILDKKMSNFNRLALDYDWIFMHSLSLTRKQFVYLNSNIAKKIIWCVWGSDLYNRRTKFMDELNFYKKVRRILANIVFDLTQRYKVRLFNSIGIGFMYDRYEINRIYGNEVKVVKAPYGLGYGLEKVRSVINQYKGNFEKKPVKIMVGHSAYPFLNHELLLRKLEKFKEENIIISIPLSYGDDSYSQEIEQKAIELYGEKVEVIKNYMSSEEYLTYLMSVDIALFDYKHQSALGNIYLLLFMGKKLFLNNDGIIYKAMRNENVEVFKIDDISNLNFNDFINNDFDVTTGQRISKLVLDEKSISNSWYELFTSLKNNINNLKK
ncbi:TDP-N-acetylfucosamine:lipid II N-acetylfucosaminyltransferase [Neobacillus sp. NPDC093127]|uniref:TDP-N-acetylfucosamine:lipid II N-acetylfucosaminyltransferase n=1 Tax=Neobacillus sp. NPDC093127 TaxID=3364296 RepID=UPI00380D1F24